MGMMLSVLADRKLKYLVILKSKCLPKDKLCGKGRVAEELMVHWQEVWGG
jgi:hypothetical protein